MATASSELAIPINDTDHVAGPDTAPITLVEYADFECPYSAMAQPIVRMVQSALGDQVRFAFRHFPLNRLHPHAEHAAAATEAASAQGKFWDMHDMLFAHQDALEDADLVGYASDLGLDGGRIAAELSAGSYYERVRCDLNGGISGGVHGTPTFFINGLRYDGSWQDTEAFIRALTAP